MAGVSALDAVMGKTLNDKIAQNTKEKDEIRKNFVSPDNPARPYVAMRNHLPNGGVSVLQINPEGNLELAKQSPNGQWVVKNIAAF